MPTVNQEYIEQAKRILEIEELTLEERLNLIIYITIMREQENSD